MPFLAYSGPCFVPLGICGRDDRDIFGPGRHDHWKSNHERFIFGKGIQAPKECRKHGRPIIILSVPHLGLRLGHRGLLLVYIFL
jgi:hypothetical protein